jgi:hypothetical protein
VYRLGHGAYNPRLHEGYHLTAKCPIAYTRERVNNIDAAIRQNSLTGRLRIWLVDPETFNQAAEDAFSRVYFKIGHETAFLRKDSTLLGTVVIVHHRKLGNSNPTLKKLSQKHWLALPVELESAIFVLADYQLITRQSLFYLLF